MKHSGKITSDKCQVTRDRNHASRITHHASRISCLSLIVLVSTDSTRAATTDTDSQGNPYQAIVGRNVFSLKPPPPPPPPEDPLKKNPPPIIKLQGLQTILGRRQVLFKVPPKPPSQPKEESFVMNEGERQGEIEVLEINMQAEAVKFKNHGQEQLLNMKDDADRPVVAAPPPGLPPGALPGALPGVPPPIAAFNPSAPGTITTIGGSKMIPQRPMRAPTPAGGVPMGTTMAPQTTQPAQTGPPLSPEAQILLMELHRQNNDPNSPPLPPTPLTPPAIPK